MSMHTFTKDPIEYVHKLNGSAFCQATPVVGSTWHWRNSQDVTPSKVEVVAVEVSHSGATIIVRLRRGPSSADWYETLEAFWFNQAGSVKEEPETENWPREGSHWYWCGEVGMPFYTGERVRVERVATPSNLPAYKIVRVSGDNGVWRRMSLHKFWNSVESSDANTDRELWAQKAPKVGSKWRWVGKTDTMTVISVTGTASGRMIVRYESKYGSFTSYLKFFLKNAEPVKEEVMQPVKIAGEIVGWAETKQSRGKLKISSLVVHEDNAPDDGYGIVFGQIDHDPTKQQEPTVAGLYKSKGETNRVYRLDFDGNWWVWDYWHNNVVKTSWRYMTERTKNAPFEKID